MTNDLEAALREALTNARTWFSQIADNARDPSEPVADNGATVWDAVRDFCVQRARDIDAALSAISGDHLEPLMTEEQVKHMVDRFLSWRLPKNFNPDNGISYTRPNYHPSIDATPNGTNLFDAAQATEMVRYMVDGLPAASGEARRNIGPIESYDPDIPPDTTAFGPAPSEAPNVERVCESYPIILNGDHAEFEAEWAGKDPKTRPDWPLPSFDARDWAEAFCKTADKVGHPNIDVEWMTGWFANALMRGYDHQAPRIAELKKELDSARACPDCMSYTQERVTAARAEGIAAMRERAAKVAESESNSSGAEWPGEAWIAARIAAAIRAGAKP